MFPRAHEYYLFCGKWQIGPLLYYRRNRMLTHSHFSIYLRTFLVLTFWQLPMTIYIPLPKHRTLHSTLILLRQYLILNLLGPPVSSNFWCTFSGDSLDWDIGLTFSQRLAILHPHQNSRFTQQKHAIYAFAKSKSLEQKIYLLILSLHYLITLKMFIIMTQSTQEQALRRFLWAAQIWCR